MNPTVESNRERVLQSLVAKKSQPGLLCHYQLVTGQDGAEVPLSCILAKTI